jgi:hyaluronan synthase
VNHTYHIPRVTVRRQKPALLVIVTVLTCLVFLVRHLWYVDRWSHYRLITIIWTVTFLIFAAQWVVSWLERPYTVTAAQQARLDRMRVTVNVPVWNEEPLILDRVLYSLFHQTRLPDRVQVVDDCSDLEDYREVREYWLRHHHPAVEFSWVRQRENLGKKRAQRRTFEGDPADIFVTLDSDTTLALNALEEGLKPFADRRVQSVAGLELAWNHDTSLLTRIKSVNALTWQFVTCSAQHVLGGQVLVNRGTFALYRGNMIRETLNAYTGETFMGRPVLLADDTMLTLWALGRGRAVQQVTAVCFAVYPETLSHTMRQWLRWMRGTSLRTLWRMRYLSPLTWAWWYTVLITWGYLAYLSLIAASIADWPRSRAFVVTALVLSITWNWITATRMFTLRRSDQGAAQLAEAFALVPIAIAWMTLVLRPVRLYGQLTMHKQGWVTRLGGAETRSLARDPDEEMSALA